MNKRHLSVPALALAAALTLSACGADSGSTSSNTSSELPAPTSSAATALPPSAEGSATTGSDAVSQEHNDADVMFVQTMTPHHQQAVEMSEMMLVKDGISPEITDLATTIRDAQGPEIETMADWLETWGEPIDAEGAMEGHDMNSMDEGMDGMMSEDQMAELESAGGDEASRMFLETMTAHHQGAVSMAQAEIDNGENPEAITLARAIVETQQAEIAEMQQLLAAL